ncbi:MAG: HAD-IIIA family hydrolase, partial [Armatimonadota bacterium]|nr:HAD-IIIA family hydrolase [Armatimonadota bacterium]
TNQSGLARGYFTTADLEAIHLRLRDLLAKEGVSLDAFFICPHHPSDHCDCRKPAPGLALQAAAALEGDLAASFVVGDKVCDIALGQAVGATTILVRTGYGREVEAQGESGADFVVDNLMEAARVIARVTKEDLP